MSAWNQVVLEEVADPLDDHRRERGRGEDRDPPLAAELEQDRVGHEPLGDYKDRDLQAGHLVEALAPGGLVERLQEGDLARADDLHPARLDVGVVAGEGEAGLLDPGIRNLSRKILLAPQDPELQIGQLGAEQLRHLHVDLDSAHPAATSSCSNR